MRAVAFEVSAFKDFVEWGQVDRKTQQRISTLILDVLRSPFDGLGKPEALKHELQGYWSRRITDEHRLVYKVSDSQIMIVACRYHYK